MKQLRSLFEWVALIVSIVGYVQVISESGPRRSPASEMNDFTNAADISSIYYQELKQAGLFPSFDSLVSSKDYCAVLYPNAKANYRGAFLAADCYLEKNNPQQTLYFLNIATQLDANQAAPYYYRGLLYLSLNQYTQGQSSLRQALNVTSDTFWRNRIERELLFSTINVFLPFPFMVGLIFIAGLEIAKNLGLEISSKKWAMILIGVFVIWAISYVFMTIY